MESFVEQTGERSKQKKVYVNPNFKRSMHVNPNFSHQFQNHCHSNKSKIFINPNFIKLPNPYVTEDNLSPYHRERTLETENIVKDTSVQNPTDRRNPKMAQLGVSSSRYSLVIHRDTENKTFTTQPSNQIQTIQVNKYKSVSLNDVKKTLENTKFDFSRPIKTVASKHADSKKLKRIYNTDQNVVNSAAFVRSYESRYKIIQRNKYLTKSVLPSVSVNFNKSISQLGQKPGKIKMNRKLLKKNNIPCPLFRKYGKCLRHIQGHCGFLHDKKHVTVCRLFIKGKCHNTGCLLSHDLSLQKMPTCYFFLKGMCTKDNCPYLHVKLNERAKICADFSKGYCDKGDDCMNRHVNMSPAFALKETCSNKQFPYPQTKNERFKKIKNKILKERQKTENVKNKEVKTEYSGKNIDNVTADCRYYKDPIDSASSSDVCNKIKPIRCKLGTLPSFIEL